MQEDQSAQTHNTAISADEVSSYLRSHPQFLEQHASLLTEIFFLARMAVAQFLLLNVNS